MSTDHRVVGVASAELRAARLERRRAALAARPAMSPPGPSLDHVRIATWNVNSIRARLPAVERFLDRVAPDVLCLQETKTAEMSDQAVNTLEQLGFRIVHVGSGAHNGVAIAARHTMSAPRGSGEFEADALDREPRIVSCVVEFPTPVRIASVYVPHGRSVGHWHYEYKLAFLAALARQVRQWLSAGVSVIVAGDVNVAPTDSDVFHPDAFVGATHVTPAERAAFSELLTAGLVDVDVAQWGPRARRFTWWNHGIGYSRNLGMRLDVIAADAALAARLEATWIDHVERGAERPSDHAALIADFRRDADTRCSS